MAITPTTRRAVAAAALSALCLGFSLPSAASDTAREASSQGLERAAEARGGGSHGGDTGDDSNTGDDGGGFSTQGFAWR